MKRLAIVFVALVLVSLACYGYQTPSSYWNIQVLSPGDLRQTYWYIYGVTVEETETLTIIRGYNNFRENGEGSYKLIDPVVIQVPKDWTYCLEEYNR